MIVFKFGGTSVGSAENIKKVAAIINDCNRDKIVVLSAVSGTTNSLVEINNCLANDKKEDALAIIDNLEISYNQLISELFNEESHHLDAQPFIKTKFEELRSLTNEATKNEKIFLAQGEIISTNLFQIYQKQLGNSTALISALDFMSIDTNEEPENEKIKTKLTAILANNKAQTIITQGFICLNPDNEVDNLKRGGSDYSASLIGAAINAEQIQIWTDIDGMHNNDPRYVENTFPIGEISFDEAAELAYFGAKILHPQSIIPAQKNNIPVLLKNTFNPEAKGTLIKNCHNSTGVRAIAAKDGIIAIKIKSYRMLMAYGFLNNVFAVFEKYHTPIDMITTSEIAVSLTIDNQKYLKEIVAELNTIGKVEYDTDMSIICLAGNFSHSGKGISAAVLNCLTDVAIRMISYGGSQYNISLLVEKNDKVRALNLLNEGLFVQQNKPQEA